MGKGDKRSRRGKIQIGSTGVKRPKKKAATKKTMAPTAAEPKPKKASKKASAGEKKAE